MSSSGLGLIFLPWQNGFLPILSACSLGPDATASMNKSWLYDTYNLELYTLTLI